MIKRHRMPALFGLSMLDVLCCGLGAVILLMLLHFWDARRQAAKYAEARKAAEQITVSLEDAQKALTRANTDLRTLKEENSQLLTQLADASRRLEAASTEVAREKKALTLAEESHRIAHEELLASQGELTATRGSLAESRRHLDAIRRTFAEAEEKSRRVENTLAAAQKRTKEIEVEMARVRQAMKDLGERMHAEARRQQKTAEIELAALREKLDDTRQNLSREKEISRENSQKAQKEKAQKERAQGDERFAGVDLRGRRVVFLIDISGSMGSVDAQTPDATKWPEVTRTVGKLLNSLPEVEKFQVVLFSDSTQFLLARQGEWLDFERERSPADVTAALARITPRGNTNMYAAFDAAFRYKDRGLDTIYLFSDGLPNIGAGLPAQPPTDEVAQSAILGKYLRDTIRNFWNNATPRVQIHAVGFFYESPNLGAFLWALTRENGGSFVGMSKP